ncbi:MAG: sarcosine oxidase subunit gamma [Pseudomonadota bacterium]
MAETSLVAEHAATLFTLPVTHGAATLSAAPETEIASIAPFRGLAEEVGAILGQPLPEAGAMAESAPALLWAGHRQWFAVGDGAEDLAERLAGLAAVTDQSDAWAILRLEGEDWSAVLARLSPLDPRTLGPGRTARTELAHMSALLVGERDGVAIWVMRSLAGSAVGAVLEAMRSVAAQRPAL